MSDTASICAIAHMHSDFTDKFGIPRQSGLVPELEGRVVFAPEYRSAEALRGIEGYSRLWLIWQFSENVGGGWSPTVRPPRLGGNVRRGVFATRSPFRPNSLGLSCVELAGVDWDGPDGPALLVRGADLMDGTPIFDVKPYVPYSDSFPTAAGGFTDVVERPLLCVVIPPELEALVPEGKRSALRGVLANDPRPSYQHDADREYGLDFAGINVRFTVDGETLTVVKIASL
jgi:tRNA-Thr(GGU) m(6)t(6)A37 methyltransferase TsaA